MLSDSYLPHVLARFGPAVLTTTVVFSLLVSTMLIALALVVRSTLSIKPSRPEAAVSLVVDHLEQTVKEMLGRDPRPFTPLVATLALFIGMANLTGLIPGLHAPTADLSTTAALAVIVFFAVPFWGIRLRGVWGYLRHYLEPAPFLFPLEVLSDFTRTLTLAVRLFGNVMSAELVIAVLILLAGFLVPVPIMLLAVLTSVVQAYIFSVLTIVYLSAATTEQPKEGNT